MKKTLTALALLLALAAAVASCGKESPKGKPIPRAQAAELEKQLASIQRRYEFGDGACSDIANDNEPAVARRLDGLPRSVDAGVRKALRQSFDHLFQLAASQCDTRKGQDTAPTDTAPTPTETTPPHPTHTQTTPTETAPPNTQSQPQTQPQQNRPPRRPNGGQGAPPGQNGGAPAPQGAGDGG